MTRLTGGPAHGKVLMLRFAPKFLRVTDENGLIDALDAPDDRPRKTEKLYAYRLVGEAHPMHIRGAKVSGLFTWANYAFVAEQPTDAQMRSEEEWRKWGEQ